MAAFTWKRVIAGATTVNAGAIPDDWLVAINAMVTGASGDADAYWEVANYASSSPKSLLFRPKNGDPGRIIIFGQNGSSPNTAAVRNSAASSLFIGFHSTSTSATPDASWIAGAPLTGTDYMPAVPCWQMTASTLFRLSYFDSPAGMYFAISLSTSSLALAGAGWLTQDVNGDPFPTILGNGTQALAASPLNATSITTSVIPGAAANNTTAATQNRLMVRVGSLDETMSRQFSFTSLTAAGKLRDSTAQRAFFLPMDLIWGTNDLRKGVFGKLRQVAFGPSSAREAALESTDSPSIYAYAHSHTTTAVEAIWFTNFEV